jgi:hypothetical protein
MDTLRGTGASSLRRNRGGRPYIPEAHVTSRAPLFYTPDTNVNPSDLYDERSPLYRPRGQPITDRLSSSLPHQHRRVSSVKNQQTKPLLLSYQPSTQSGRRHRSSLSKTTTVAATTAPRIVDISQYVPAATLAAIASSPTRRHRSRTSSNKGTRRTSSQPKNR